MDAINQALEAKDYDKALEIANSELKAVPKSARWLLKRSVANLRLQHYDKALEDAEAAVSYADDPSTLGEAQLRRGVALYQLKRFGEARTALVYARKSNCSDKSLEIWEQKVNAETTDNADLVEIPRPLQPQSDSKANNITAIRKDWFQMGNKVTVSVFVRDAPPSTEVEATSERISIPEYDFVLDLSHKIDSSSVKTEITKNKIEITFAKAEPGNWTQLAKTPDEPKPYEKPKAFFEKKWDIQDEDEEEESADPQSFFEKIYKDADPDARRAMMKSFIESNGTTLSTNWDEVKRAKVETAPPQGMEPKEW